jgi:hypothetical protein
MARLGPHVPSLYGADALRDGGDAACAARDSRKHDEHVLALEDGIHPVALDTRDLGPRAAEADAAAD